MLKLMFMLTPLSIILGATPAYAACASYSGTCVTPPPTTLPSPTPESLPHTGATITYGEVTLIAFCLILVGVALVTMLRPRREV